MEREALVVGVNRYPILKQGSDQPAPHLTTPATDAEAIAHLLETYGNFRVQRLPEVYTPEGQRQVDPMGKVTVAQLTKAISNLFNPDDSRPPDTALLFFAGHGKRIVTGGVTEGFLATSDASLLPERNNYGLSLNWLRDLLKISPVRQQIVWLDCCFSGELLNFAEAELIKQEKVKDRCLIAASRSFEVAYAQWGGEHGVLSGALLQALNPEQNPEGWVTNYTLLNFINQQLKTLPQRPMYHNFGGEILLTGKKEQLERAILQGGKCPYKGLEPFDFNDEDPQYFYGRSGLVDQLLDKVKGENFLAVAGASGSGKSSVVKAGLLYQLKLGQKLSGSDSWVIRIFRPGDRPLESLARTFAEDRLSSFQARELIAQRAEGLKQLVQKIAQTRRIVLVIDQFEEVFTLCQDETERQHFFESLLGALEITDKQLCVIITLRADFFGKCLEREYAGLARKIEANLINVTPMTQDELEEAITEPARQVGLEVQRELVEKILEDVEGPGSLPLLQYTLTELWRKREVNRLTLAEYIKLGGVKKTLQKRADEVYQGLNKEEKKIAQKIFLELTQLGEGTEDTRRQVLKADLVTAQQEEVLDKLINARLVVTSEYQVRGDESKTVTMVDVAHEALIRHWEQLRQWVDENRVALRQKRSVEEDAKEWEDKRRSQDLLLQGLKLEEASHFQNKFSEIVPLSPLAQGFVQASIKKRRNNRRLRFGIGATVAVVLLSATGISIRQATIAELGEKAATVKNLLQAQPVEGLVLAIKATGESFSNLKEVRERVQDSLLEAVQADREQNRLSPGRVAAISPDGNMIVTGNDDGTLQLWNRQGQAIGQPWRGHEGAVSSVAFSPDGNTIVSGSADKTVRLWNRQGQAIGQPWRGHEDVVYSVAFSRDGNTIVSGSYDNTVRLWKGNWKTWLQTACNQLREHTLLVKDKDAGDTCLKMGG